MFIPQAKILFHTRENFLTRCSSVDVSTVFTRHAFNKTLALQVFVDITVFQQS